MDDNSLVDLDEAKGKGKGKGGGKGKGSGKFGKGGKSSPFEKLRNPNAEEDEDDDVGAPAEPAEEEEFTYEDVMDETEAACYAARYTDLNGTDPNEHYARVGAEQGRNIRCLPFLTQI